VYSRFEAIFKCKMKSRWSEEAASTLRTYFRLFPFTTTHKHPSFHLKRSGSP
jgi:hypothetical protein